MIVWGGIDVVGYQNTGARYNPTTNAWTAMVPSGAALSARSAHTAVWTGTQMVVWGGINATTYFNDGAIYSPSTNTWVFSFVGPLSGRQSHTAVWDPVDGLMAIWGGYNGLNAVGDGAAYNPVTHIWVGILSTSAPSARDLHAAVWLPATSEMVIWGGSNGAPLATGGRIVVLPFTCGVGACLRPSGYTCTAGNVGYSCTAGTPSAEVCNGIDDNCDSSVDNGIAPPGVLTTLTLTKQAAGSADLSWSAVGSAQNYDAARGGLNTLRSSSGDFTSSTDSCLANNTSTTPVADSGVPAVGAGYWYLVRGSNCGGVGSYNESVVSQSGSRDAEIAASPSACP
jgi:hypothetical protein